MVYFAQGSLPDISSRALTAWSDINLAESIVHPEDRTRFEEALRSPPPREGSELHLRILSDSGLLRYAEVHLFCVDDGTPGIVNAILLDVTEQREVENALYESAAFYRAFLEQSPIGMLHLDAAGIVTIENHPFRQIVGQGVDDAWIGLNIFQLEALDPTIHPALRSMLDDGIAFHGLEACFASPNALYYLIFHGAPIRNQDGMLIGAVLMIEDVTREKRREQERALRAQYDQAEADLRVAALDSADEAAFLNEAARIFGRTTRAERVHLLYHRPATVTCVSRAVWLRDRARSQALRLRHLDYPLLRPLGTKAHRRTLLASDRETTTRPLLALTGAAEARWIPFYDEGVLGGFIVIEWIGTPPATGPSEAHLIDHLAGIFEALWAGVQARNRYRHTIANIDDGLFNFTFTDDGERRYLFATHQFERLVGYAPALLLDYGDNALRWREDVLHPSDRALVDEHDTRLQNGQERRATYRVLHRDGTVRWLHEHATPHSDLSGNITVGGILTDVTEQKKAEAVLVRANREAEASNQAKTAFIARMSHEIRTPLGVVHGYAELMANELREISNLPPEMHEFAEAIHERAQHLLGLVNNLFDISSIDAGELRIQRIPVDLRTALAPLFERYDATAKEKGLAFRFLSTDEICRVMGDPKRIEQIVGSLLSNALKFTDCGSVTVRLEARDKDVLIEVSDTGIGMKQAYLDQLFTSFSQEEDWRNRQFEGTGLGLAFARRLLDLLGGRIEAHSRKGKGSRFSIYLPAAPDEA